jgi:hypothetical protein
MSRVIPGIAGILSLGVLAAVGGGWPAAAADHAVTNCADNGAQLRALVGTAAGGDTIILPSNCVIVLRPGGTVVVTQSLTIVGQGAEESIVDGGHTAGVFDVLGGVVTLRSLTVRNGHSAQGGGIRVVGPAHAILVDVLVAHNRADSFGGGIAITAGATADVLASTVSGNASLGVTQNGGGIDNLGVLNVALSTISGNSALAVIGAGSGGGIWNGGAALVQSSTITANAGSGAPAAGGIRNGMGSVELRNTIVARNADADCSGLILTGGHNLDGDNTCGLTAALADIAGADPRLGPLRVNRGGPLPVFTSTPTHALLPGSPAIDAGTPSCPSIDQRGVPRPLAMTVTPAACDIGPFEAEPLIVTTGTGPTGGPHVRLFQVTTGGEPLDVGPGFLAYDAGFLGGVQATLVKTRFDTFVVTGVGSGGGPHIKLFRVTDFATGAVEQVGPGFLAYDVGFLGGVRVAATVDVAEQMLIVTGVGAGGGAHVKVFRVTSEVTGDVVQLGPGYFAYDPGFLGGVTVGTR